VCEVLGVDRAGLHDNFFDLGANSLHVVRIHQKLCAALGVEMPVVELFRHPSVGALAGYLGAAPAPPPAADGQARAQARQAARGRRRARTGPRGGAEHE
jgi:acyl carrier protein